MENDETVPTKKRKLMHSSENGEVQPQENLQEQLRQFDVLDEVHGDESGSEESIDGCSSDSESDGIDIENMLDEGLPDDLRDHKKEQHYVERYKTILDEKGRNHFEVLPEGWLQVTHNSGIPMYLHKATRVCSVSRPYFLGTGSVRKHEIPISAIPCLSYRKALEEEEAMKEEVNGNAQPEKPMSPVQCVSEEPPTTMQTESPDVDETKPKCPFAHDETSTSDQTADTNLIPETNGEATTSESVPEDRQTGLGSFKLAKIETVKENLKSQSLNVEQIYDYCRSLFKFKSIRVMRFKSWSARRKFTKNKKNIKNLQRPTLPDGTKLITFPILPAEGESGKENRTRKEWIMNPNGKSFVCILHEYVQHALKKQPTYEFKELENAATPYSATVSISDLKYGTGFGTSKKQAKAEAARETLEVFIPEMRDKISGDSKSLTANNGQKDLSVFDEIRIEDPRVDEFCNKTTEPSPHAILTTCLKRNYGLGDIKFKYQVKASHRQQNEYTMFVGKHEKTVVCKSRRDGKQLASQAILQILHPHIKTYGSLLRLYGNHSVKSFKEKKQEEQEITVLQSKAAINQPNYAILDKLKCEMQKLMEQRDAIQPIGTFIAPAEIDLPQSSGSNLNNVNL